MTIQINGQEKAFPDAPHPFTVAALVEILGMKADRLAIELNLEIVPRDRWPQTTLNDGDRLEVVHFVGGGTHSVARRELS
jgi:thiamine biosynthesis protein ThiS